MTYEEFYKEQYPVLLKAEEQLKNLITQFETNENKKKIAYCSSRIKSPESMKQKLLKKGEEPNAENAVSKVNDAVGIRVITSFVDDIYKVSDWITLQNDIEVVNIKDYIAYIQPERDDLGIGGCWNIGIHHSACGKFAIQLDSDDVYSDEHTLRKIVEAFYEQRCAMVVGTYRMTDFDMRTIPPGIIDHKEWTPENGRNNALRINGLGAPRAFYTPLLRKLNLPNTSYGEDYALGLRISREYPIGRIYDVLYLCRRWEDNSDASLDVVKMNNHNIYKDKIRTWELEARLNMERQ